MAVVNVSDFEEIARGKLKKPVFDFIAGGAEDEVSLARNLSAWGRYQLLPRVLVDVRNVDASIELLGVEMPFPLLLAPVAYQRLVDDEGEKATARAAAAAGVTMVLSTMATCAIEEVAAAADGPKWFQLYVNSDRKVTQRMVERAENAGFRALCLTVDVPYLGRRERDIYNKLQFADEIIPKNYEGMIDVGPYESGATLAEQAAGLIDPGLTWECVDWLRSITTMPVLVKGVLAAADAKLAVEHGAAAVIVSNHGGRQLDSVVAPVEVLEEVVGAVAGRVPVLVDGGVRRGTDIVKALALGASAVLIGRPYVWGLASRAEKGVGQVIEMLREEFRLAMALCGCRKVGEISRALVRPPAS
jgi:(S)-2-hydroxy-acid oxidase